MCVMESSFKSHVWFVVINFYAYALWCTYDQLSNEDFMHPVTNWQHKKVVN
jgi:hypothetical protein